MTMQSKGRLLLPRRRGLAASNLHEELDECRDRNNDGRPESDFNLKIHGTGSLTLRFSGQPPSYVDLRTMDLFQKKNRVFCCDCIALISCTRFAFSLLNLCLHLSLNPPHTFNDVKLFISPHSISSILGSQILGPQMPEMDVVSFDHTASSPV